MNYKDYCKQMKSFKQKPMDEEQFNEMMGIDVEVVIPLLILPKRDTSKVTPTFENYKKVTAPKKVKAVKEPRVFMTKEEARLKRNERQRNRMALIRPANKAKKVLTEEERKEYKREYMKRYRKLHPYDQVEANKRWREANPEKHKEQRRKDAERRRVKLKESRAII